MKPTSDDDKPRRDGWHEHRGTWGEVTVGTVIASQRRTERWEIIATAHGQQVEAGHTLWMRAREQTSRAQTSLAPRSKWAPVTILTQNPADTQTPPSTPPSDSEAIMLLVQQLGAVHLATRDNETGEITCPDYAAGSTHAESKPGGCADEIEHLRFAHGLDTGDLEALPWDQRIVQVAVAHGRAHNPKHPEIGKGGFPHRHVPEDHELFRP